MIPGNLPQSTPGPSFQPGGYASLVPSSSSISPVPTSDQASKTEVYYRPDSGNMFPVLRNGVFEAVTLQEDLKLTLTSAFAANGIFDVFGILRGATPWTVAGPAWDNAAKGAGDRGSDPGDTTLERVGGLLVNKYAIPGLNGEGAMGLGPREGVYLYSLLMNGSAGQVSCLPEYGQSRIWGVWNAYNRRPITLQVGDSTATWTHATGSGTRSSNNDSNNQGIVLCGLAEESVRSVFRQRRNTGGTRIGIGWNVTASTKSGFAGFTDDGNNHSLNAEYVAAPFLGRADVTCLEESTSGTNNMFGGQDDMQMLIEWMG